MHTFVTGISASTFCDNYTTTCGTISAWSDCKTDFVNINVGKGDKNADTQACRLYNLGLAEQSTDNAKAHCPHASKAGGGVCVDNATNFCARYTATCNNISAWSTCAADFAKFGAGSGTGNADTQACRLYHLSLAETSTDYGKTHCPHASKDGSKVCVEEEVVLKSQGVGNTSQSSFTLGMSDVGKCCTDSFTVISCPNEDEYPEVDDPGALSVSDSEEIVTAEGIESEEGTCGLSGFKSSARGMSSSCASTSTTGSLVSSSSFTSLGDAFPSADREPFRYLIGDFFDGRISAS